MESAKLKVVNAYTNQREKQGMIKFFMALREYFEGFREGIINYSPFPNIDSIVNKLLAKEIRVKLPPYLHSEKGIHTPPPFVFVAYLNKGKH